MPSPPTPGHSSRPKRSQISIACQLCRVRRTRCDGETPCRNCQTRGVTCTYSRTEIRTLPHAYAEIERLKLRVQELEREVEARDDRPQQWPPSSAEKEDEPALAGFYASNANMPQKQLFGPSSLFYFIHRMTSHLATLLEHPPAEHTIQYNSAAQEDQALNTDLETSTNGNLTAIQEEYFLGFFWQSYHCSYQILDETIFRQHYQSLWIGNRKIRRPSPLVDIILALCIQLESNVDPARNADIAGRWHYQRCQTLLISELETPSISTLQSQIFSVVYLCCASFQNMAHGVTAMAIRTAQILGVHLEPPRDLPRSERELQKRLWWTLVNLESKTCIKLGRPWLTPICEARCSLPADDHELAIQSGSAALAEGNVTWLSYTLQSTKLILAARNMYVSFHREAARILADSGGGDGSGGSGGATTLYDDHVVLERCARFLKSQSVFLYSWAREVPEGLCIRRQGDAERPFSTDVVPVTIKEALAPLWLQRQRLFLELVYHNLCVILYRPLISFSPGSPGEAPAAEECAAECVGHAIAMTRIIHQALMETDFLKGWHEGFQWQWNAAITTIGFILANPASPLTGPALNSIPLAVQSFEMFGKSFVAGTRAAKVVADLEAKIGFLFRGLPRAEMGLAQVETGTAANPMGTFIGADIANVEEPGLVPEISNDSGGWEDILTGTMDVAFSVDSFNSSQPLQWGVPGYPDIWGLGSGP
ncbi:transcriptional activator protein acu-15 [Cladorrhinum sp. PSN259]|nr:transcriptional activator protein acu-15 [Cladorrhinum sp. PSN259]